MKVIPILIIAVLLSGCATWFNHHDVVEWPDGSTTKVKVSADGVVIAKDGAREITADHRGRPSVIEQVLGVAAASVVNRVEVKKETSQ